MAFNPWTPAEDDVLRAGIAAGQSAHSLAKSMKRSKDTLRRHAAMLGLSFSDPERLERTRAATKVAEVTNAERRSRITARLYAEAEAALSTIEGIGGSRRYQTLVKGLGGAQEIRSLSFVPPEDRRAVLAAVGSAVGAAVRAESVGDKGGDQVAEQTSMITALMEGLRAQQPTPEQS